MTLNRLKETAIPIQYPISFLHIEPEKVLSKRWQNCFQQWKLTVSEDNFVIVSLKRQKRRKSHRQDYGRPLKFWPYAKI